jgi:hypothetical protein
MVHYSCCARDTRVRFQLDVTIVRSHDSCGFAPGPRSCVWTNHRPAVLGHFPFSFGNQFRTTRWVHLYRLHLELIVVSWFGISLHKCQRLVTWHVSEWCKELYSERYEGVSESFRTDRLQRELQMVQRSATRCSCIAILWVGLVSFAAMTICVASQRVIPKVSVYFVIDSVWKLFGYTLVSCYVTLRKCVTAWLGGHIANCVVCPRPCLSLLCSLPGNLAVTDWTTVMRKHVIGYDADPVRSSSHEGVSESFRLQQ